MCVGWRVKRSCKFYHHTGEEAVHRICWEMDFPIHSYLFLCLKKNVSWQTLSDAFCVFLKLLGFIISAINVGEDLNMLT